MCSVYICHIASNSWKLYSDTKATNSKIQNFDRKFKAMSGQFYSIFYRTQIRSNSVFLFYFFPYRKKKSSTKRLIKTPLFLNMSLTCYSIDCEQETRSIITGKRSVRVNLWTTDYRYEIKMQEAGIPFMVWWLKQEFFRDADHGSGTQACQMSLVIRSPSYNRNNRALWFTSFGPIFRDTGIDGNLQVIWEKQIIIEFNKYYHIKNTN